VTAGRLIASGRCHWLTVDGWQEAEWAIERLTDGTVQVSDPAGTGAYPNLYEATRAVKAWLAVNEGAWQAGRGRGATFPPGIDWSQFGPAATRPARIAGVISRILAELERLDDADRDHVLDAIAAAYGAGQAGDPAAVGRDGSAARDGSSPARADALAAAAGGDGS
jgi:hypothetical protein